VRLGTFVATFARALAIGDLIPSVHQCVRELRVPELTEEMKIGEKLSADLFSVGDKVDVTSNSKGKGFAGTIKRHNFHRGRKTHGGRSYRRPGSIGSMYPQRIFPGKKMSGQMGNERPIEHDVRFGEERVCGADGTLPEGE